MEYIEFWLMDPFIYTNQQSDASEYGGDLYINLGEVSEDILKDGKKFYESGMPVDGTGKLSRTRHGVRFPSSPHRPMLLPPRLVREPNKMWVSTV